ncbi:uncharacterized protein A4U43_C02F21550 [Asparagus officinalis]|uniref:HMA domain-containing protein n=1 Tax=Asparagus officinalis TaxID=4686 RepID=A0A5P1FLU4_ASPOF|nr:uncharacterized protein A4U43_C02F21550 [Asparagus officinalis]
MPSRGGDWVRRSQPRPKPIDFKLIRVGSTWATHNTRSGQNLRDQAKGRTQAGPLTYSFHVGSGIDKMEIDSEKNTMTVIGTADPMDVIKRLRKVCKSAEIVTIGPPAQPKPAEPPKPKPAEPSKPKPAEPSKPAPCPSYPPVCFSGCPWNCTACVPPRYIACHEETPQFCTLM